MPNNKGAAMVAVLAMVLVLNIALIAFFFSVNHTRKKSGIRKSKSTVLSIAEAGKEHLYGQVRWGLFKPEPDSNVQAFSDVAFQNGSFSVSCSSNAKIDTIWVKSEGKNGTLTSTINVTAALSPDITIPFPPVRGAVTALSGITVKGNIELDGRDHDTSGNLIGNGIFGLSTCGLMSLEGSATVGGYGVVPVDKNNLATVEDQVAEQNTSVSSIFDSPEAFLGLPDGSLEPFKTSTLTTPFSSLVYFTQDVGPVHFGNSCGILIVHNQNSDAELQITGGLFKGLIICDRMAKISGNAQIIGAVVSLSAAEVSTFGTGTAIIQYSRGVLEKLNEYCRNINKNVAEIAWHESN